MTAPARRHFRAAMFGFAVAAIFVSYQLLTDSQSPIQRNPAFMIGFVILCPPSLLSVAIDTEAGTSGFYILWTVIALMNAGLYTAIRMLLAKRLQHPD